jgi:hypothetical protein
LDIFGRKIANTKPVDSSQWIVTLTRAEATRLVMHAGEGAFVALPGRNKGVHCIIAAWWQGRVHFTEIFQEQETGWFRTELCSAPTLEMLRSIVNSRSPTPIWIRHVSQPVSHVDLSAFSQSRASVLC